MNVIQFREEAKLCLFTDDIVLYIENPKEQTKMFRNNENFIKLVEYKFNKNQFYYQ